MLEPRRRVAQVRVRRKRRGCDDGGGWGDRREVRDVRCEMQGAGCEARGVRTLRWRCGRPSTTQTELGQVGSRSPMPQTPHSNARNARNKKPAKIS
eukprot:3937358-Rhodomonas_salina.1